MKPDGQIAFEAFQKTYASMEHTAPPMLGLGPPLWGNDTTWSDLPQDVRNAWQVAAQAVRDVIHDGQLKGTIPNHEAGRGIRLELAGHRLSDDYAAKFTDPKQRAAHGDHRVQIGVDFNWQDPRSRVGSGLLTLRPGKDGPDIYLTDLRWTEVFDTLKPGWVLVPEARMRGDCITEILAVGLTYPLSI